LQIGSLQETIRVRDTGQSAPQSAPPGPGVQSPTAPETCTASAIGGRIVPPKKLRDVKPYYPPSLRGTTSEALVVLEARIGTDGRVKEVHPVSPTDLDVENAAIAAV